jgi:hypothetical protein
MHTRFWWGNLTERDRYIIILLRYDARRLFGLWFDMVKTEGSTKINSSVQKDVCSTSGA